MNDTDIQIDRLRCACRVTPEGITERDPQLSWILRSSRRGAAQTAYRILVASSPDGLAADNGDCWDSGRVESGDTNGIVYGGEPLRSGQVCWWKVRAWDENGTASAWSEPSRWSMGLLEPGDWKGHWIGCRALRGAPSPASELYLPPPCYLRAGFSVKPGLQRAVLYVTALGICQPWLNGAPVGDDYFLPGWTDYTRRVYVRAYEVTASVCEGANALGAVLADGWFSGYIGPEGKRDHYGDGPCLRMQLHLAYADGAVEIVTTGEDWRAGPGPIREADFLMGETYDARMEQPGWCRPGFDDADWQRPDVLAHWPAVLENHPAEPVRVHAELAMRAAMERAPGCWILDFGQTMAGFLRLRIRGKRGRRITLRFGERLDADGGLYTANLRGARATDAYICGGNGEETWSPRFTYHGFRYVEVTGLDTPPEPGMFIGLAVSSDTPVAGDFTCSNPMINRLFRNIYWTQRANFIDIPTDCPQRDERLGWTGDAQVYIRTASLLTDVQAFFRKWMVDLDDTQRADGAYPCVAPLKVTGDDGGPGWAEAGVICPWTMYEVYGDRRVLERHYEAMARYVEFVRRRSGKDLLPPPSYHCFGDWLNIDEDTPKDVIFMAYFACAARLVARAAAVLGRAAEAADYEALFRRVRASFARHFADGEGHIPGDSQCAYVLALAYDLLDGSMRDRAAARLVACIERRGVHLSTGFLGTKDLMVVLSKIGREDIAYRLLMNTDFPSWGFSVLNGATTIWERWDGWTPEKGFQDPAMNSFMHYAFGAVGEWLIETVAGIRHEAPGYARILIEPRPNHVFSEARGRLDSVRGPIESAWIKRDGVFSLHVVIPANATARVCLPWGDPAVVTESGVPAGKAPGVRFLEVANGRACFEVSAGTYAFTSPCTP